jgi:hypothetical protein
VTPKTFRAAAAFAVPVGFLLASCLPRKVTDVAQRSIEILIGRLITDEAFRSAFRSDATTLLTGFIESGYELTPVEITALCVTPADVWERVAEHVDPRLQKASFAPHAVDYEEEL